MLYSIIIYTILALLMIVPSMVASIREGKGYTPFFLSLEVILVILSFSFIMGARYGVGTDYFNYLNIYNHSYLIKERELGFRLIAEFLAKNKLHFSWFFGVFAFIQMTFLYYAFDKERYLYPHFSFLLIFGAYFVPFVNVIRQGVALAIFIFSVKFIDKREFWRYLFWVSIAVLFHKSAVFVLPLYFLLRSGKDFFPSRVLQVFMIACSYLALKLIYSTQILSSIFLPLESFLELFEYNQYSIENLLAEKNLSVVGSGMGFILMIIIDLWIVFFSNQLKLFYNSRRFTIFYNLYFIGVITRILFSFSFILLRPFLYFTFVKMIILAYFIHFLWKNIKQKNMLVSLILTLFLVTLSFVPFVINGEENNTIFEFYWDK